MQQGARVDVQHLPGLQHALAVAYILAAQAHVLARLHQCLQGNAGRAAILAGEDFYVLDRYHRIQPCRHARTGHDFPGALAAFGAGIACCLPALNSELGTSFERRAVGAQREAVHRRIVERRQ